MSLRTHLKARLNGFLVLIGDAEFGANTACGGGLGLVALGLARDADHIVELGTGRVGTSLSTAQACSRLTSGPLDFLASDPLHQLQLQIDRLADRDLGQLEPGGHGGLVGGRRRRRR